MTVSAWQDRVLEAPDRPAWRKQVRWLAHSRASADPEPWVKRLHGSIER